MTKTVREFSSAGPCLNLGILVKRTNKTITFTNHWGETRKRGGWRVTHESEFIHTEPCRRCMDHEKTDYPNGYMD